MTPENNSDKNIDLKSKLKQSFEAAAARIAAHTPEFLIPTLLSPISEWYSNNGYYKFEVGQKLDCKGPQYFGYGLNAQGWEVTGYDHDEQSGDRYIIETADGEIQRHFKWNIENQFKVADPNAKPFDPERFKPKYS